MWSNFGKCGATAVSVEQQRNIRKLSVFAHFKQFNRQLLCIK